MKDKRQIVIEQQELDRLESLAEINESVIKEVLNEILSKETLKIKDDIFKTKEALNLLLDHWRKDRKKLWYTEDKLQEKAKEVKDLKNSRLNYKINIFLGIIFGFALAALIFYK